ncbi:MAG: PAS domain-containing protein [Myxococcota bacterium]
MTKNLGVLRVLLVDDDEEDYLIARELFEDIEHFEADVEWLDTYERGIEAIGEERHDVYFLDYHLGARDGLELLQDAISLGVTRPIIMLTGQGGRDVDLEAMKLGAYDYLIKGRITSAQLERSIRYALQHSASTEALRRTVQISSALLTVVSRIDQGVMITDPLQDDNPVVYVNERFLQMTGYGRGEFLGRNPRFLQGPETEPAEIERMAQAMGTGQPYVGVMSNYRADGTVFRNHLEIVPVRDDEGHISKYVSLCREA